MNTFEDIELIKPVLRALADENYKTPTPIQAQTIPPALLGHDVLGCAQTGTGKTAAFALPILNRLGQMKRKATPNRPYALILAPTRELAVQIGDSFATYGKHLRLRQVLVYGGVGQRQQVRSLDRGAHILIATPGRLLDLMNQGHIELDQLQTFVLDEADRMLDMGFLPDLKRIIKQLPEQRQSLFFSATLSPKIVELAETLLRDHVDVNVTPEFSTVETIEHRMLFVQHHAKQSVVEKILRGKEVLRALVFTKTKRTANSVAEKLVDAGMKSTAIHGNKSQAARQKALNRFRSGQVQVLVATDVAARGIDVDGVTHVINFDLPIEPENYVHRIGRTGRAGADGIALSFCTNREFGELRAIETLIGQTIPFDPEHPRPEFRSQKSYPPRGGSRRKPPTQGGEKRSYPKKTRKPGSVEQTSEGDKPKRSRRPRRKFSENRVHTKQKS